MKIAYEFEFNPVRCQTCGSYWAVESGRYYPGCRCPRCAGDEIVAANERADAAVRSAAASKANATRKLNRRAK